MNVSYRKYTGINQKNDPGAKPLWSPIVNDSFVEELDESFDPAKARKGNAKGKKNQGMQWMFTSMYPKQEVKDQFKEKSKFAKLGKSLWAKFEKQIS